MGHHKAFATTSSGPQSAVRWVFNIEIWYEGARPAETSPAPVQCLRRVAWTDCARGRTVLRRQSQFRAESDVLGDRFKRGLEDCTNCEMDSDPQNETAHQYDKYDPTKRPTLFICLYAQSFATQLLVQEGKRFLLDRYLV